MTLTELKKKNPGLPFYSVLDPEFAPYGRVIPVDTADIVARMEAIPMPESGSRYVASCPELEASPMAAFVRDQAFGGTASQMGFCWGYNRALNALEWHTCSEINLGATDLVLLLALRSELDADNRLDASCVRAFYLPRGVMIEVYGTSLHYCPCQVSDGGFRMLVGLTEKTNTAIDFENRDPYLFARNKWLVAHDGNAALLAKGARPGIHGENYVVNY